MNKSKGDFAERFYKNFLKERFAGVRVIKVDKKNKEEKGLGVLLYINYHEFSDLIKAIDADKIPDSLKKKLKRAYREIFKGEMWKTKDGRLIKIKDMTDTHLLNSLKALSRWATKRIVLEEDTRSARQLLHMTKYYELSKEAQKRKIKIDKFD